LPTASWPNRLVREPRQEFRLDTHDIIASPAKLWLFHSFSACDVHLTLLPIPNREYWEERGIHNSWGIWAATDFYPAPSGVEESRKYGFGKCATVSAYQDEWDAVRVARAESEEAVFFS
jgi:hypothetical protein